MAAAIFRAKFAIPCLPSQFLSRPRLNALWQRPDCRLITLTAGAGWGKTDFLAERAQDLAPNVLWYTVDDLDRDPSVLAAHLAAACGLPVSSAPPLEKLAAIIGHLERCRLLVLDDVHTIAQARAARDLLGRLLRYLPAGCALALGSREPLDLPLARLDGRGQTIHLGAADLALTPDETRSALQSRLERELADAVAPRVQVLTEGWPIGLEICCQALAAAPPGQAHEVLARLEEGRDQWFEMFSAEVMAELEPELRSFLLHTAVLPHLDADLCDEFLGRRDSRQRLQGLANRGLFLVELGEKSWRTHNLMRRCLQRLLEREVTPAQLRKLTRRAAALLAGRGEPEAAALDLVRAGDVPGAGDLLRRHARRLAETHRPETLALALAGLPNDLVGGDPALLLIRAGLANLRGDWDAAENDLKGLLRRKPSARIAGTARAQLVRVHMRRGQFSRCLTAGKRALDASPRPVGHERGSILSTLGVAAASLGRLDQGRQHLHAALQLARRGDDAVLEGQCRFLAAANIHFVQGDLETALQEAGRARDLFRESGRPDLACHAEGVLGFVLAGCGRPGEAREASTWALTRAESIGYRLIAGYARLTLGMCDLLADDPAAAFSHFGEALNIAIDLGEAALETWTRLGLAEAAWRRGQHERARDEAGRALELATQKQELFSRARALAHLGRLDEGEKAGSGLPRWREAERIFKRLGADLEYHRLLLWQAAAGQADAALVQKALNESEFATLLARVEPTPLPDAPGETAPTCQASPGDAPLHLRLLGPLEVRRGDDLLPPAAWRSRRARRLFQLLVLGHARTLPRDAAMEAMWPETPPRKAALNLRQTVYQLRRILEPAGGDGPVHVLADGESLRLELGQNGTCDLESFEAALGLAQRCRRDGRAHDELVALRRALDLWRGPLLADSPFDPEVDEAGSVLRYRYLRAMGRRLDLHAARGDWEEVVDQARRALGEDPLSESHAHHLLRGLLALDLHRQAREEYARFEARYVKELDLLPSESLKELAERAG